MDLASISLGAPAVAILIGLHNECQCGSRSLCGGRVVSITMGSRRVRRRPDNAMGSDAHGQWSDSADRTSGENWRDDPVHLSAGSLFQPKVYYWCDRLPNRINLGL